MSTCQCIISGHATIRQNVYNFYLFVSITRSFTRAHVYSTSYNVTREGKGGEERGGEGRRGEGRGGEGRGGEGRGGEGRGGEGRGGEGRGGEGGPRKVREGRP